MSKRTRVLTIRIPEYVYGKLEQIVKENKKFISKSEVVRHALAEFIARYEKEKESEL